MCRALNYFEHFLIFVSIVSRCVSISAFASIVDASIGISISAILLKAFAITAGIKKYKSIIKEMKKKHDKIVFLVKTKLNTILSFDF